MDIDKVTKDIIEYNIVKHKLTCDDCYKNFLIFLKISYIYTVIDTTFNDDISEHYNNIVDFLGTIDVEKYHKLFLKSNIYACNSPNFMLYYINKDNQLLSNVFIVQSIRLDIDKLLKSREINILYMHQRDNILRYAQIPSGQKYLFMKDRLLKERKKKLEKIDENKVFINRKKKLEKINKLNEMD